LIKLNDETISEDFVTNRYEVQAAGTKFKFIRRRGKERITAKGPLTEAIVLEVKIFDSCSCFVSL
jgi:hypothetical protein